jgi:lipoate-protein ligase B
MSQLLAVKRLGTVDYAQARRIQADLWLRRVRDEIPDTLLLLEHPPTITAGQAADLADLLVDWPELRSKGISFFFADRGGGLTFHAPGQLVAYPIVDLRQRGKDVLQYLRDLEKVVILTLSDLSIGGRRDERQAGVWAGRHKIASIGVAVRRWVTTHGVAINVCNDLGCFSLIRPCGADQAMSSVSLELGREVAHADVVDLFVNRFAEVFGAGTVEGVNDHRIPKPIPACK